MFNDERITIESGKIFKKANIITIIISMIFLIARMCVYIVHKDNISFGIFSTELCAIITATVILLYGEFAFRSEVKDERAITDKYRFYSKHGKTLLIWILVGYAISMIDSFRRSLSDVPPNHIIFVFQTLGVVYFYYVFKKNQININYTFIENDKKTYYKHVWKLIGYLSLIIIAVYMSCGMISLLIYQSWEYLLAFMFAAITSILGLGLQYLLLSFLEKKDYDNDKNKVSISFLISGLIVAGTYLITAICSGVTVYVANNGLVSQLGSYIAYATQLKNNIAFITTTYLGVSLSYLLAYCVKNKAVNKMIFVYFVMLYVTTLSSLVFNIPLHFIKSENEVIYYQTMLYVNTVLSFSFVIIFGLIVYFLIKEKRYNKKIIIIPIIEFICFFVGIYLSTQGNTEKVIAGILNPGYKFIEYLLFYFLVYKFENIKDDNISNEIINE